MIAAGIVIALIVLAVLAIKLVAKSLYRERNVTRSLHS